MQSPSRQHFSLIYFKGKTCNSPQERPVFPPRKPSSQPSFLPSACLAPDVRAAFSQDFGTELLSAGRLPSDSIHFPCSSSIHFLVLYNRQSVQVILWLFSPLEKVALRSKKRRRATQECAHNSRSTWNERASELGFPALQSHGVRGKWPNSWYCFNQQGLGY